MWLVLFISAVALLSFVFVPNLRTTRDDYSDQMNSIADDK